MDEYKVVRKSDGVVVARYVTLGAALAEAQFGVTEPCQVVDTAGTVVGGSFVDEEGHVYRPGPWGGFHA